jgi:hypothetical protein
MKKRSFLLPLAVSLTALGAGSGVVNAKPATPTVSLAAEVAASAAPAKPLVLERATGMRLSQYHTSHASHSSHSSHYSSR